MEAGLGADLLGCVAAFLGPRAAARAAPVCRRWHAHLGPRRWDAGAVPLVPNLQRLGRGADVLIVHDDDAHHNTACHAALEAIAAGAAPCPGALVLRPLPVSCAGALARLLGAVRPGPHDVDLDGPAARLAEVLPALTRTAGLARLALTLHAEEDVVLRRVLAFAYARCAEAVLRVRTLRGLLRVMPTVGATGGALRRLVVRTSAVGRPTRGFRGDDLARALAALPAGLTDLTLDLASSYGLADLGLPRGPPATPPGAPVLGTLRLGLAHTQITPRGLDWFLAPFAGIADLHVDVRYNEWSPADWRALARSLPASTTRLTVAADGDGPGDLGASVVVRHSSVSPIAS